jgi:hypothetical protein
MGPRAGLDTGARRKILCPCRGSNPDRPTLSQTLYCLSYIVIEDKTLEQVNHFKYLSYDVTFLEETDIDAKIKKFQNICGTVRRTLNGRTRKDTQNSTK